MSHVQRFRLLFSALMSMAMSAVLTGWGTWLRVGFSPSEFVGGWAWAFVTAWPAAFAAVLVLAPWVNRLSQWLLSRLALAPQPQR